MRWTIGRRLAVLGIIVVAATMSLGGIGYVQAGSAAGKARQALAVANIRTTIIDCHHTAAVVYADVNVMVRTTDAEVHKAAFDEMNDHASELRENYEALKAARVSPATRQMLVTSFFPAIDAVLAAADAITKADGVVTTADVDEVQNVWEVFDKASDSITKATLNEFTRTAEAGAAAQSSRTRVTILLVALFTVVVVAVACATFARAIAHPVNRTMQVLDKVADGDFTQRLAMDRRDDLGEMARALDTTINRVGAAIRAIAEEARNLYAASGRIGAVSEQMAAGAQRISAEADAAADAADHVNGSVQAVADSTDQMHLSISAVSHNAGEAAGIVGEAVEYARTANATIAKLGDSSAQIGEVAKVIITIAEQTNLLALNATIEAARAGESGKGFAVVAGEVKELANETAKASEDIGQRIAAIQTDSVDAVQTLERITQTIDRIAGIQKAIATAVDEQAAATSQITTSVADATRGTAEIGVRIEAVERSSMETSTMAGDTRSAASDLASTSTSLQQIVQRFRVSEE